MIIEDLKLRDLRKYIGVGYCRSRQTNIGCRFRPVVANAKPDDKVPFGCEDCLSYELNRRHDHAQGAATLIQYTTWHYLSLVSKMHQGKMHQGWIDKMDFIKWKMRLAKIDKAFFDEVQFIHQAATDEIINRRLAKERTRIDREAAKASKEAK